MSEEELVRQQQMLFQQARINLQQEQASSSTTTSTQATPATPNPRTPGNHSAVEETGERTPTKVKTEYDVKTQHTPPPPPATGAQSPFRVTLGNPYANPTSPQVRGAASTGLPGTSLALNPGAPHMKPPLRLNSSPLPGMSMGMSVGMGMGVGMSAPPAGSLGVQRQVYEMPTRVSSVRGEIDDGYDESSDDGMDTKPASNSHSHPRANPGTHPHTNPSLSVPTSASSSTSIPSRPNPITTHPTRAHSADSDDDYDSPDPPLTQPPTAKPPERVKSAGSIMSMLNDPGDDEDYDEEG